MKLNRKEIMEILQIKNEALKKVIQKDQLMLRLYEKGYKYIDKIKEGRNTYFIVEKFSDEKELYNNIVSNVFNTKEEEKFTDYFVYRISNTNRPMSKQLLSEKADINRKTVGKWDLKMIEHKILNKDGYFYIAMELDKEGNKCYRLTDKFEYNSYVKNSKFVKLRSELMEQWKNNKIDDDMFNVIYDGTTLQAMANEGKFVYRINKFELQKDSELAKEMLKMIINLYNPDIRDYILNFLPVE
ncbi:hypothetical protein AB2T90_11890 [Clostridium butyricum]|uniref:hypothetical protein n=1 Tax=Clostridium butyricum TaxID=1492 RepID=UPI003467543B